jgi:hypothetical protein
LLPTASFADSPAQTVVPSGWGFTSDGGFALTESSPGNLSLAAKTPGSSSGASQVALRTQFPKVSLTPGDSATLSGEFTIDDTVAGASCYLGWSWSHIGLLNSNGNAGTLADSTWSGSNNQGFTGYLLILTTGASGVGSAWGDGALGPMGALLAGNAQNYYAQNGGAGLGGDFQSPDTAGIDNTHVYNFTIKVTRLSSYLSQIDYDVESVDSDDYVLKGTVYDRGVNADGTPSAISFDTIAISTTSSSFTSWNFSNVKVEVNPGDPNDPDGLYDFESGSTGWSAYMASGTPAALVSRVAVAPGTMNDTGALSVTVPNGLTSWAAELNLSSSDTVAKAIMAKRKACVDLVRYGLAFDLTFLTSNSGGYTGVVNTYAAMVSGSNVKVFSEDSDGNPLSSVTWDGDKMVTVTVPMYQATIDETAGQMRFIIGFTSNASGPYTVLVDNVRLVPIEPTTALRQQIAAKYLNTTVDADGYACPQGLGWLWVSDYPYVYSFDLDGWRGGTADYSYGWLWAYGNVSTGAWFWDFFTEKWFYSDSASWPWAYFYEGGWAYLENGHDAIVRTYPVLPNPLEFLNNTTVNDLATWNQRREEIKELFMENEYGHRPPAPQMEILGKTDWKVNAASGVKTQTVTVKMTNGDRSITTSVYIAIPAVATADNPRPIMMSHEDLYNFGGTIYDFTDRSTYTNAGWCGAGIEYTEFAPDSPATARTGKLYQLYGDDIDTGALMAWAWAFSRVVDVLEMLDYPEIDLSKIAVTGHSRYGKCALLAGAFDERIALTAPSHSGSAGSSLYKVYFPGTEALNVTVGGSGHWLCPKVLDYKDDASTLPVDGHLLTSLVAPRGLIQIEGSLDTGTNPRGVQLSNMTARTVYDLLGADNMLGIRFRPVGHIANDPDVVAFGQHIWYGDALPVGYNVMPYAIAPADYDKN